MKARPNAALAAGRSPTSSRGDEPSVAEMLRSSSRTAPNSRDEQEAQLRARLLQMIVANEASRQNYGPEGAKPR